MFQPVSFLLGTCVSIYVLIVILEVGLSWLITLDIVNADNDAAKRLTVLLKRFTEPAYLHLRKYVPPVGGFDICPLVLVIGVQLVGGIIVSIIPF